MRKRNLFYIETGYFEFEVKHRQIIRPDRIEAVFHFGKHSTVSKTRALKAAKVFCKQMNIYYPTKINL